MQYACYTVHVASLWGEMQTRTRYVNPQMQQYYKISTVHGANEMKNVVSQLKILISGCPFQLSCSSQSF